MIIENVYFRVAIDEKCGALSSLFIKKSNHELIGEKRLSSVFRLCAQVEGYQCNYIESAGQKIAEISSDENSVTVRYSGLESPVGHLDIDLSCTVILDGDSLRFSSALKNNSDSTISEFWFPRIGGITRFDKNANAKLAVPGYLRCRHSINPVTSFPGGMSLGCEAAEWSSSYPGMVMPWTDIYDADSDTGMYFGYHDKIMRYSTWHMYLHPSITGEIGRSMFTPEEACGEPVGIVFSHVRYPFLKNGESFSSGEFILRVHSGDWHSGSGYYRKWFMENFPFDKKDSWLRQKSAWFSSIIYQPEDKVITDYKGYDAWCRDAEKYGINCHELIGWDKGGLERDYPEYYPEEKLGGREDFRELMSSIRERGSRSLVFVNYNVLDSCSELYKKELHRYAHQDPFGNTPNWMCWGESTLLARNALTARRHHLASVIPEMEKILEGHFLELVKDGADGFQIDKLCVGSTLDFNPLNSEKPDTASCEGLIQAIGRLLEKCREINPDFRLASEASQDRLLPYIDVYYRAAGKYTISPLRYVFPECTACVHIYYPMDFQSVNSAVITGAVITAEPYAYQASVDLPTWRKMAEYIAEVERIRAELKDIIFTGEYCDELYAHIAKTTPDTVRSAKEELKLGNEVMIPGGAPAEAAAGGGDLHYRVHRNNSGDKIALTVANSGNEAAYTFGFDIPTSGTATLYSPFEEPKTVNCSDVLLIPKTGLHIIVADIV